MRLRAVPILVLVVAIGCRSPIAPPPPPSVNTPPTAAIVSTTPLRVEADETLEVRADVNDDETPLDQLEYTWSAGNLGGTFTRVNDNPRQVRWQAPRSLMPAAFSFTLSVVERYQESGVEKSHAISASSASSHYNDSPADILRIATRFLTELFPNYSVTPEQAVQDFSDSCPGKYAELHDIAVNRARTDFRIVSGEFSNPTVTLNAGRTRADVSGACEFRDMDLTGKDAGRIVTVRGTCILTAVYEPWKWFLCDSHFKAAATQSIEGLRFRVPGWRE